MKHGTYTAEWTRTLPVEEGHYWFFGYLWGTHGEKAPRLEQVQVRRASNAMIYIACSSFLDTRDLVGFFTPMAEPDTTGLTV